MERNLSYDDISTRMVEAGKQFEFRYIPINFENKEVERSDNYYFDRFGLAVRAKMSLGGIVLAEKIGNNLPVYQHSGMNFRPYDLVEKGLGVLNGKTDYF